VRTAAHKKQAPQGQSGRGEASPHDVRAPPPPSHQPLSVPSFLESRSHHSPAWQFETTTRKRNSISSVRRYFTTFTGSSGLLPGKMRYSIVLATLLSVANARSLLGDKQSVIADENLQVPGESPLQFCEPNRQDDIVTITSVDLLPNPPQAYDDPSSLSPRREAC